MGPLRCIRMRRRPQSIVPTASTRDTSLTDKATATRGSLILCAYNFCIWFLLALLLFAQLFGIVWPSVTTKFSALYGQPLALGLYAILGLNDEPYADRVVACVRRGQNYYPMQLTQLLRQQQQQPQTSLSTNGMDGYRVVSRDSFTMDATQFWYYNRQCSALTTTLDSILSACERLGYNVTRDVLRVVDGVDSDRVIVLPNTLPVLINPFWDFSLYARYIVPGRDGSACVFRLTGTFESESDTTTALFRGVPRDVRETTTVRWLGYAGGVWRNGWYEDPSVHMRWYSDIISTTPSTTYGVVMRQFNLFQDGAEDFCPQSSTGCSGTVSQCNWGDELVSMLDIRSYHSIMISNGSRFGLFLMDAQAAQTTTSYYTLEKLISNASFSVLLSHWLVAMVALSHADGSTIGIGAITSARLFLLLPVLLLPRLRATLESFWSSGCNFEGDQTALVNAWFVIYPAIGEMVFLWFSLLNTLAKPLRRRMTDALFGPTLLFFTMLHFLRLEIAMANVLEFDSRVASAVTPTEAAEVTLSEFFMTDWAFRMNGRVYSIFCAKLIVLGLNILPLLLPSTRLSSSGKASRVEQALAKDVGRIGGLGVAPKRYSETQSQPYDLVRGGYVVVGPLLVSIDHWMWMVATALLRRMGTLVHVRVVVFEISQESASHAVRVSEVPRLLAVSDHEIADINLWQVTARACE